MSVTPSKALCCKTCGSPLADELCPSCAFGDVLGMVENRGIAPGEPYPKESRKVGDYELIEEIGRGGMGVVWKANHSEQNRAVALKLVRGGCLPGEILAKRFRREAGAAAKLRHPNIVAIHEVGECDG